MAYSHVWWVGSGAFAQARGLPAASQAAQRAAFSNPVTSHHIALVRRSRFLATGSAGAASLRFASRRCSRLHRFFFSASLRFNASIMSITVGLHLRAT